MDLGTGVLLIAVFVIGLMSLFFIVCRKYEEGLFGNLALALLVMACAVTLYDGFQGRLELPAPVYLLMILCFAAFMLRHGYRFAMFHWHGWFGWQPPSDIKTRAAEHG